MYHHSASRRGGRAGRRTTHSLAQPSSAAAKAAAAAKALHRRAQERSQEKQQRGDEQCCKLIRNRPDPTKDVFRRNFHVSDCQSSGSILKRLTPGHNQRFRIGPSTKRGGEFVRDKSGEHASAENKKSLETAVPKYLHHTPSSEHLVHPYIPHATGVSGGYPIPPGPYGHHHSHFFMHHHGHSYLMSTVVDGDGKGNASKVNYSNFKATATNVTNEDEPHPTSNSHSSAPHRQFEGGLVDPTYPFGVYSNHYPPGYYPPYAEAQNASNRDIYETNEKKQYGFPATETLSSIRSKIVSGSAKERVELSPPPPRSTRCIIGSHTPIHVPRAATHEVEDPLPYREPVKKKVGSDPGSVFRSSESSAACSRKNSLSNRDEHDLLCESNVHKILLSLSKSFDRVEEIKHFSEGVSNANCAPCNEERPKSPNEPPRIQHLHKQSSDSFEPQPSPLKLSYLKDADCINIDLTSSFTLFNESFDMNIEGLLGPNASFGFGPMRSLSFGLGLGASIDLGDNPRIHRQNSKMSPNAMGENRGMEVEEDSTLKQLNLFESERAPGNLQVSKPLLSTPVCSVGRARNYGSDSSSNCIGVGSNSIMALRPSRQVGSSSVGSPFKKYLEHSNGSIVSKNIQVMNGNGQLDSPHSMLTDDSRLRSDGTPKGTGHDLNHTTEQCHQHLQKIERSLFRVMERHITVFNAFSFLLPGAKTILVDDSIRDGSQGANSPLKCCSQLTEREKEVARRRVNSALCAFGGMVIPPKDSQVWPRSRNSCEMQKYRESIPERFYEDDSRLSWEIEEDPPIEVSDSDGDADFVTTRKRKNSDDDEKFLCKVCGAHKRDHDCLSETSLQRNIGVMVYPAVNAFTATEPGIITPALSEMNNFVDKNKSLPELTATNILDEVPVGTSSFLPMVSPDSVRPGAHTTSSSLLDKYTPQRSVNYAGGAWISNHQSPRKVSPGKISESQSTDLLFVDMQELEPEQFRIVAQKKRKLSSTPYVYPPLPLPYGQRKRISNAMFAMSKSIPGLTDECASVLGEARRKDAWDFAVAQLMTQVIVVTHCSVEDSMLDGLSKYLLTLGIAC